VRLARKKLAQSGLDGRVELRLQRIEQIDDDAVFTLAWLPGAFIAAETVVAALERVYKALVPGGWLVFGALCATAKCAGRSTHQFANRARRWSSVDDKPSRGAAPRAWL
jgi:hypothetical protein